MIKIVNLQKSSHRVKLVSDSKRENESEVIKRNLQHGEVVNLTLKILILEKINYLPIE
jgi:hypothetical protein